MPKTIAQTPHPGSRIRAEVIPPGMKVAEAARRIGVGRPALSNLLNGKAALSAEMAARLEKAFDYSREDLMEMQARYEAAQAGQIQAPITIKAYVPPFLGIKASAIQAWSGGSIAPRTRFAVLLRTLVHSTGSGLTQVNFPGNDDAERPGWDGIIEANEGTAWIPAGRSGWEFGTSQDPKQKANEDFNKSVDATTEEERLQTTFVFVTPRRWPGLRAWVADMQSKRLWKDVRAYDASDLEQWLEQSLPGQVWFANETGIPAQHVRSLDRCWADWANVSTPAFPGALFAAAIKTSKRIVETYLSNPPTRSLVITADSTEEALAFLAQVFSDQDEEALITHRDRVLVFGIPGVLPSLTEGRPTIIPVARTREVERELAPHANSLHSFTIYPRNAVAIKADITLEPINHETFNTALSGIGKNRDEISQLANDSGRSLTVLRRRLSNSPAIRRPEWAEDWETAAMLVPFLLVGAWDRQNSADSLGLSLLAGDRSYDELERQHQKFTQINDAPVWSSGNYRGVISKIDLLYAIAQTVTARDLERYFSMACMVLGEDDPALDLEENQRWAASLHGKTREFSTPFREGISETLVLLAVHGKQLFNSHPGIDIEREVAKVVRDLLPTPLTTRILQANARDLPTYAEAAPNEFLSIIESDLQSEVPATFCLLNPVENSIFSGNPSRTGLLFALEGLAWNPQTLQRAVAILARLAQVEPQDNLANKPTESLLSIFRACMPQTAATQETRIASINELAKKFPDIVWKICIAQFSSSDQIGHYNHKPRWRNDGMGFGEPLRTSGPIRDFVRAMADMVLKWPNPTPEMLCDLVQHASAFSDTDQNRLWEKIETWAKTKASDVEKAIIREKVRGTYLSHRAAIQVKKQGKKIGLTPAGESAYAVLEPSDLLNKHEWMFRDTGINGFSDQADAFENMDLYQRAAHIDSRRTEALREILTQRGLDGILEFSRRGKYAWKIGNLVPNTVLSEQELQELLRLAFASILADAEDASSCKRLIAGVLNAITDDKKRETAIQDLSANLPDLDKVQLLLLAPFRKSTWNLVDILNRPAQTKYWHEAEAEWINESEAENHEAIERLLKAGRPRAAFACLQYALEKTDGSVISRVLSAMAQEGNDQPDHYMTDEYHIEEAFKYLTRTPAISLEEKAGLEFAYIELLASPWDRGDNSGIPNLERYIEVNPELFVQAITWTFKRNDGAADPPASRVESEHANTMAERGYKLLVSIGRIPGHNDLGELEADRLAAWIEKVRHVCIVLDRIEIADNYIGKLLSRAPVGKDGVWPCEPVREVMEKFESEAMMEGAHTGAYNARGVHWRGEGGSQERELAEKYRTWGQAMRISHPFVASRLLGGLAETYDHDASRADAEGYTRKRLR